MKFMKSKFFILASLISVSSVWADKTVLVKGNEPTVAGRSEVSVTKNGISDSIVVVPSTTVTHIEIAVVSAEGETVSA